MSDESFIPADLDPDDDPDPDDDGEVDEWMSPEFPVLWLDPLPEPVDPEE